VKCASAWAVPARKSEHFRKSCEKMLIFSENLDWREDTGSSSLDRGCRSIGSGFIKDDRLRTSKIAGTTFGGGECDEPVPAGASRKPNSVPASGSPSAGDDHSSADAGCPAPRATYPGAWAGHPQTPLYLVLHRVGFAELPRSPGELVRSYRTVSPLPSQTRP